MISAGTLRRARAQSCKPGSLPQTRPPSASGSRGSTPARQPAALTPGTHDTAQRGAEQPSAAHGRLSGHRAGPTAAPARPSTGGGGRAQSARGLPPAPLLPPTSCCAGCVCCASPMPATQKTCTRERAPACAGRPAPCWCASAPPPPPTYTHTSPSPRSRHPVAPWPARAAPQPPRGSAWPRAGACGRPSRLRTCPPASQEWCRANRAECLAVQPPGRAMRLREPCATSCQDLAAALLPVVASKLYDTPYVVRCPRSCSLCSAVHVCPLPAARSHVLAGAAAGRHAHISGRQLRGCPPADRGAQRGHLGRV
jgi:hypothetical protein